MMKHSDLPFRVMYNRISYPSIYSGQKYLGTALMPDNAEFIVKACNAYYVNQEEIEKLREKLKKYEKED